MNIEMTSNKPYIVKAFYDWISDNGLTPYILVDASVTGVIVPLAFVNDGQIVLNVSGAAVGSIALGEHVIELSARFGGQLEHITVPYGAVGAIYAKENGAGTSLAIEHPPEDLAVEQEEATPVMSSVQSSMSENAGEQVSKVKKPSLSVVK